MIIFCYQYDNFILIIIIINKVLVIKLNEDVFLTVLYGMRTYIRLKIAYNRRTLSTKFFVKLGPKDFWLFADQAMPASHSRGGGGSIWCRPPPTP